MIRSPIIFIQSWSTSLLLSSCIQYQQKYFVHAFFIQYFFCGHKSQVTRDVPEWGCSVMCICLLVVLSIQYLVCLDFIWNIMTFLDISWKKLCITSFAEKTVQMHRESNLSLIKPKITMKSATCLHHVLILLCRFWKLHHSRRYSKISTRHRVLYRDYSPYSTPDCLVMHESFLLFTLKHVNVLIFISNY